MLSVFLKNLSILKKFLFINFIVFLIIGILTLVYFNSIQPLLIKDKTSIHIKTLNNTIENLNRLKIKFNEQDIKKSSNPLVVQLPELSPGIPQAAGVKTSFTLKQ